MTKTFNRILSLLRCSILGKGMNGSLFSSMTPNDWVSLMNYVSHQGLTSLCFQAFERSEIRPPMDELMDWLGQSSYLETCYDSRSQSAKGLCSLFWQHGIDMMVLKGLALSHYYPAPKSREFGDLDIFVFDKHDDDIRVIREHNINVEIEDKHDVFDFEGTHVELHKTFLSVDSKPGALLNDYLLHVSKNSRFDRSVDNWLIPNADFNAVFLLRHMTRHLASEGMTLRNVLDYALLLLKEGKNIHWDEVKPVLKKAKMNVAFDTMVAVCEKVLDVDFSRFYMEKPNPNLVDRVMDEVMNVHLHAESGYDTGKRVWKKTQRLFSRKWMYDSGLLPDAFWTEVVWGSVRDHIKKPKYW